MATTVVVTFLTSGLSANALGSGNAGKGDHLTIVSYATHCQFRGGCYKTSATLADDGRSDVEYVASSGAAPVLYHPGNTFNISMHRVSTTLSCSNGWLYFIEGHHNDGTPSSAVATASARNADESQDRWIEQLKDSSRCNVVTAAQRKPAKAISSSHAGILGGA